MKDIGRCKMNLSRKEMPINDLKQLHEVELELVDEIDRICTKYNLIFFLDSGSALGAIRHKGFIPWDDDVDIGMPRKDYQTFLKVAKYELKENYFLQTKKTDPAYKKYNAKLRKKGTFFPEDGTENYLCNGISIDLFPFDYAGNSTKEVIRNIKYNRFLGRIFVFKNYGKGYSHGLKKALWYLISIAPLKLIEGAYLAHSKKYATSKYVVCYYYHMFYKSDLFFLTEDIMPTKRVPFEDRMLPIMNNADAYLKMMYGDYMVLPPLEKRTCHAKGKIIFNCDSNDNSVKH